MKYTLLALSLVASLCSAEEVVTTGYGNTFESALRNAKISAIAKVTGTWISSEHFVKNGTLTEEIVQYNGGVIKKYEVLSYHNNEVKIKADVDVVKDNRVGTKSKDIPTEMRNTLLEQQQNRDKIQKAVKFLDSKSKAMNLMTRDVSYNNKGSVTEVTIKGTISWTPKWVSDTITLGKTIDVYGRVNRDTHERVSGSIINAAYNTPVMLPAVFLYGLTKPESLELSDQNQLCFVNDSCYVTGVPFTMFDSDIRVIVEGSRDKEKIYNTVIKFRDTNLYEIIAAGDEKRSWFGTRITYNNPTVQINTNTQMNVTFSFVLDTKKLSEIDKFDFVIN
jgi:hypothetical protein